MTYDKIAAMGNIPSPHFLALFYKISYTGFIVDGVASGDFTCLFVFIACICTITDDDVQPM